MDKQQQKTKNILKKAPGIQTHSSAQLLSIKENALAKYANRYPENVMVALHNSIFYN
jgi:hypothetical protein